VFTGAQNTQPVFMAREPSLHSRVVKRCLVHHYVWPVYTGHVHGLCSRVIKTHNPCSWPVFTHAVKRYIVHPHVRPMGRVYGLCTQFTHRLRPEYTDSKHGLQHTCFLRPTRVHNPNAISTGSAIFEQLTTQCPYNLQWAAPTPSPLKIVPSMGSGSHLIHGSLRRTESSTQMASRSVETFLQGSLL